MINNHNLMSLFLEQSDQKEIRGKCRQGPYSGGIGDHEESVLIVWVQWKVIGAIYSGGDKMGFAM